MGGSGDYFDMADTVIAMENFQAQDVYQGAGDRNLYTSERRGRRQAFWSLTPRVLSR